MAKIKVLYLLDTLEVGGAERSLVEILSRFRQTEPVLCSIYQGQKLKTEFEKKGVRVYSLDIRGKYSYITAIRKVLRVLRHENPDLIHTTLARSHFIGRTAGRMAHVPVISSFVSESYSPLRFQQMSISRSFKLRMTRLLDRTTARWAFHFLANSETVKNSVCQSLHIHPQKITVVYRGRDPSCFLNANKNHSVCNPGDAAAVILNVGRLVPSKAQTELILAMPIVLNEFPVQLLIAGEGPHREELQKLIVTSNLTNSVTLLGHRDDVPQLLQVSDIFAFPSLYEGHPGALIEAMFSACPVVASDISVHREMLKHQETGLLTVPNSKAIAEAILYLLRNREQAVAMGERARATALNLFHIDSIAARHEEIYAELFQQSNVESQTALI